VPFEVPESWEWTTIDEIAESNIGLTYRPDDITGNGIPVYRSNNIQNGEIDLTDLVRVKTDILEKQFLHKGDLLICARNGSRNLVGKSAIIKELDEPSSFGAFMAVCRSAYNKWIFLILNSDYFNSYLDDSNSTAINQVTQKMLLAFRLPLPPLAEQERLYNLVMKWFSVIDMIDKEKANLREAIKSTKGKILDLAVHGKLVPQDPNDEPAIELLRRINPKFAPCDNAHYPYQLPKGWCWTSLETISTDSADGPFGSNLKKEHYTKKQEVRIIQLSNIGESGWREENTKYTTFEHLQKIARSEVFPDDIVIAKMMPAGRAILCPNHERKYVLSSDAV